MANPTNNPAGKELMISHLTLRRLIGMLGLLLPIILPVGTGLLSDADWLQISLSHFYYSVMHIVFTGVLCLLGGFLITYRGPQPKENLLSTWAGLFALGVALFPTNFQGFLGDLYIEVPNWKDWFEWIHYGSAGLLLVCFAIFCFKIFKQADDGTEPTGFDDKKKRRNNFYTWCGRVIVFSIGSIGLIAIYKYVTGTAPVFTRYTTYIFESTSLFAFGVSWLLKGTYRLTKMNNPMQKVLNYYR